MRRAATGTAIGIASVAYQVHKEKVALRKAIQNDPRLRAEWEIAGKPRVKYYRGAGLNKDGLIKQKFIQNGSVEHSLNGGETSFSGDLRTTPVNKLNPLVRIAPGANGFDNISHELGHAYLLKSGESSRVFNVEFDKALQINRINSWNESWKDAYNKTIDYEESWIDSYWPF